MADLKEEVETLITMLDSYVERNKREYDFYGAGLSNLFDSIDAAQWSRRLKEALKNA